MNDRIHRTAADAQRIPIDVPLGGRLWRTRLAVGRGRGLRPAIVAQRLRAAPTSERIEMYLGQEPERPLLQLDLRRSTEGRSTEALARRSGPAAAGRGLRVGGGGTGSACRGVRSESLQAIDREPLIQ